MVDFVATGSWILFSFFLRSETKWHLPSSPFIIVWADGRNSAENSEIKSNNIITYINYVTVRHNVVIFSPSKLD